jgi:hypothetical protein
MSNTDTRFRRLRASSSFAGVSDTRRRGIQSSLISETSEGRELRARGINDPPRFYQSVGTVDQARVNLAQLITSTLRKQLGKVALSACC